jgi:hypothetical protein
MGFDISIGLELSICDRTGRPFVYGPMCERVYDINLADYTMPPDLCSYARGRGPIFYAYTEVFNEKDIYSAEVETFLEEFPSWSEVASSNEYEGYEDADWNEDDHNKFKALLEWCVNKPCSYRISWSY